MNNILQDSANEGVADATRLANLFVAQLPSPNYIKNDATMDGGPYRAIVEANLKQGQDGKKGQGTTTKEHQMYYCCHITTNIPFDVCKVTGQSNPGMLSLFLFERSNERRRG